MEKGGGIKRETEREGEIWRTWGKRKEDERRGNKEKERKRGRRQKEKD